MNSGRRLWLVYAIGALCALGSLAWITSLLLEREYAESRTQAAALQQSNLRQAFWRMDSWLGPLLAREAARPYYEYQTLVPEAPTVFGSTPSASAGLVPSPLCNFHSDYIHVHFELDEENVWHSPQVRTAADAQPAFASAGQQEVKRAQALALLSTNCDGTRLRQWLDAAEALQVMQSDGEWMAQCQILGEAATLAVEATKAGPIEPSDFSKNTREFSQRRSQVAAYTGGNEAWVNRMMNGASAVVAVRSGPLVPIWWENRQSQAPGPELLFVRRLVTAAGERLQGFLIHWQALERALLLQIADLFPTAAIEPTLPATAGAQAGLLLATLPAALVVPEPAQPERPLSRAFRWTIALPWLAILAALIAVGLTLRTTIESAERRNRFASSVTHELRTPLTTFRMYSEMLARGMVSEEQRPDYYRTLEVEANRLSGLVESVLCYSRLEQGQVQQRRELVSASDLVERSRPALERRAALAEAQLVCNTGDLDKLHLYTDPAAVQQILFNLIDNACKYGQATPRTHIEWCTTASARELHCIVRDTGAGIPAGAEKKIFEPFERGTRAANDPNPGLGLGLAIARGLARDLGGELEYLREKRGAAFQLRLPLAAPARAATAS